MKFLLDTHAWIWAQLEPERLSRTAAALIAEHPRGACLSPVTFYEVLLLVDRGRIRVEIEPAAWVRASLARRPMAVLEVTADIALAPVTWLDTTTPTLSTASYSRPPARIASPSSPETTP